MRIAQSTSHTPNTISAPKTTRAITRTYQCPNATTLYPPLGGRRLQAAGRDLGTAVVGLRLGRRGARGFGLGPLGNGRHLAVGRVDDGIHLPALDGFLGLEVLRKLDELVAALRQDLLGALVAGIDEAVHFLVDLAGDLFAVIPLLAEVATEEDELFLVAEGQGTELLGHAPFGDHAARQLGGLADVIGGPRGDVAEDQFLRDPAAEDHGHVIVELAARDQVAVLGRQLHRPAERHAARDDRDFVHWIGIRE